MIRILTSYRGSFTQDSGNSPIDEAVRAIEHLGTHDEDHIDMRYQPKLVNGEAIISERKHFKDFL